MKDTLMAKKHPMKNSSKGVRKLEKEAVGGKPNTLKSQAVGAEGRPI